MREIKFRAFNGTIMRYSININDGMAVRKGYQWFNEENDVHKSTIMQFTGLKDKNCKDIYEGDIINQNGFKYEVKWDKEYAMFGILRNKEMKHLDHFDNINCEVIGNIYESTDLL